LDLIGKVEHGALLNNIEKKIAKFLSLPADEKSQTYSDSTNAQQVEHSKKLLKRYESIAKL
jgi:hypothetical protein